MTLSLISLIIVVVILATGSLLSVQTRKLTVPAAIAAFVVGLGIYAGSGIAGLVMLALFFVLAIAATAHKKSKKAQLEHMQRHQERRKAGQVLANGGVAAVLGILSWQLPQHATLLDLMLAAALSAATADTLASELGMVYGCNAVNILTFKKESRGLDGVISLEGTVLGMLGSAVIGIIFCAFNGLGLREWIIVTAAGTIGNLVDSLLGALLERKKMINNDMVNMLNTLSGALAAWLLVVFFH